MTTRSSMRVKAPWSALRMWSSPRNESDYLIS